MSSRPEVEVSIGIDISAVVTQRNILKWKFNLLYNTVRVDTPVLTGRVKPVILVNFQ